MCEELAEGSLSDVQFASRGGRDARAPRLIRLYNQQRLIIATLPLTGPLVDLVKQLAAEVMG